jgi:hypothetical protein
MDLSVAQVLEEPTMMAGNINFGGIIVLELVCQISEQEAHKHFKAAYLINFVYMSLPAFSQGNNSKSALPHSLQ